MRMKYLGLFALLLTSFAYGQSEQQERERAMEEAQSRLEEQRSELVEAQRALEEAAREVARLSLSGAGPQINEIVREFRTTGRRAMLGITIEDTKGGAVITGVSPGGPAEKAGVKSGDIVRQLNDISLADSNAPTRALIETMKDVEPGDSVVLVLQRAGQNQEFKVTTEEFRPKAYAFAYDRDAPKALDFVIADEGGVFAPGLRGLKPWARMELVELTPKLGSYFGAEEGILVVRAPEENDGLDLVDGDVILEIGDRKPKSTSHAMRILRSFEAGEDMNLKIMRNKRRRTVEFTVPDGD